MEDGVGPNPGSKELVLRAVHPNGIVEVSLNRPKVNALSYDLLVEYERAIDELELDGECSGILLSSALNGVFSGGLDVKANLVFYSNSEQKERLRNRIVSSWTAPLRCSKPIAVAVDGHAVAGGFIMAAACDFIALGNSKKFKIGLPEAQIGIPFSRTSYEIAAHAIGSKQLLREMVYLGNAYSAPELFARGFGHSLSLDPRHAALEWLNRIAALKPGVFTVMKRNINAPFFAAIQSPDRRLNPYRFSSPTEFEQLHSAVLQRGFVERARDLQSEKESRSTSASASASASTTSLSTGATAVTSIPVQSATRVRSIVPLKSRL